MPWQAARFKDKDVWIEVDAGGKPMAQAGRVPMRYSQAEGARIYQAGLANLTGISGASLDLPAGISADAATTPAAKAGAKGFPARKGSGFGSAGSRTAAQGHAARESARELIAGLPPEAAVCFTDGACKGNPGPAGAGCVVRLPDGRLLEASRALGMATNNVGELTAIAMALDLLDTHGHPTDVPAHVLTDSQYARGVLVEGWKAKANQELVASTRARLRQRKAVLHWIAGHVGIPENERADVLANQGVAQSQRR